MKKIFAMLGLMLMFAGVSFGQNLVLKSFPSGAEVTIDGTDTGKHVPEVPVL
jgi:hypothetical protein